MLWYQYLKYVGAVFFNLLNLVMRGNLPPFATAVVLVEQDGRFLVIDKPGGKLSLSGGFGRWSETPEETARRECREETGLEVQLGEILGVAAGVSNRVTRMSTLTIMYHANVTGGELRRSVEGYPRWADADELRQELPRYQVGVLEDYLNKRNTGVEGIRRL